MTSLGALDRPRRLNCPKQFTPGLGDFTVAINDGQQFLLTVFGGANQDQHAGSFLIEPYWK
jgi:hypothetical protein